MNRAVNKWYEDIARQDECNRRLRENHRRQLQDLGDLTKMPRYEAHQVLDEWYDEYEAELKAERLGDEYDR